MTQQQTILVDPNFVASNFNDEEGNHFGGCSYGPGFVISWQRGPVINHGKGDSGQNGAFLQTVLDAVIHQLEYVNKGKFQCPENEEALKHLNLAAEAMQARRLKRLNRGVSGTHEA